MLLKTTSKIRPSIGIAQNRMRSRTPSQKRPNSQTPTIKRKFTPTVNKTFTCYKDQPIPRHSRAASLDKTKELNISFKHSRTKSLKIPGKALMLSKETLSTESAKLEMSYGNYSKALKLLNKYLEVLPNNIEGVYSRAVCNMHLNKHDLAIKDLLKVSESSPSFDKQLYIALYMCYSSLNQQKKALKYLTKGVKTFPNFIQAYLIRGQLYNKSKRYEKALMDFKKVYSYDKKHSEVLLLIAESYMGLKDYASVEKVCNIAVNYPELYKRTLILKVQSGFESGKYESALVNIEKVLEKSPDEPSAFYYKGMILYIKKQFTDAALCLEQAFQSTEDVSIMNLCVFYLGTIKLNERDFYGALHTFERSDLKSQTPELKALHHYTEGVISLMKRKLEEGIEIFSEIIKKNEKTLANYFGNCYENRAFAYFSLKNYDMALSDFVNAKALNCLDKASEFNKLICEGIIQENSVKSLEIFKSSREIFPKNIMPDLCRACILLNFSQNYEESEQLLGKAESLVDNILTVRETESEVFFYSSIIKFYLKNYEEALENAKKAIEKADENLAIHYSHRGFCLAALKKYEEAVHDFTISLQLNEDCKEMYIYRAICAFLHDDLQLAIEDLNTVAKNYSDDESLLLQASKLMMAMGSFEDSSKILEKLDQKDLENMSLQAKNYLLLYEYEKSLKCVKSIMKTSQDKHLYSLDKEILEFFIRIKESPDAIFQFSDLSDRLKSESGVIFTSKYSQWLAGILEFYKKNYAVASTCFQSVLEILHDEEPEIFADSISIEEENCEVLYNIALSSFCSESDDSKSHALMIFEELSEVLNEKHRGQLLFLSAVLELSLKNKSKAEKLLKEALKCDPDTLSPFLDNKSTSVLPLHTSNDFSCAFPLVPVNFDSLPTIFIRPAMILPRSQIEFSLDHVKSHIKSFYSLSNILPRPEAPWLLRLKGSVQFTQNILEISHDIETTEADENLQKDLKSSRPIQTISKSQKYLRSNSFNSEKSQVLEIDFEEKIKNLCND